MWFIHYNGCHCIPILETKTCSEKVGCTQGFLSYSKPIPHVTCPHMWLTCPIRKSVRVNCESRTLWIVLKLTTALQLVKTHVGKWLLWRHFLSNLGRFWILWIHLIFYFPKVYWFCIVQDCIVDNSRINGGEIHVFCHFVSEFYRRSRNMSVGLTNISVMH